MNAALVSPAPLEVRLRTPADDAAWDAFARVHPNGTFFHLSAWADVIERAFGHRSHYLLACRRGAIEGVLPLVHLKSLLFGNALMSIPFGVYGGVLAANDAAANSLIDAACALARDLRVGYLELRNREPSDLDWPTRDLYATFRKTLLPTEEANFRAIPKKRRAEVRKGIAAGLVSEVDAGPERLFAAYSESVRNLGTPVFGQGYFREVLRAFGKDCEVLTVLHRGEAVASVMSFYFRDEVLPFYGGGTAAARDCQANDFLYWELMRRALAKGVRIYDYGRSKRGTGSFAFKEYWGFEPAPLHYQYYLVRARELPNVSPANPKYRMFIRAWQHLPLPVSRAVGPLLARSLG
ncbi:MAG TPA: FemAB family XrtA/PEP-CTERM system-associated protein [Steroidobacteraceae bacterium]|nr:FemAB family XrtA/PEP-CTERM system-associated protein [Steroidobacteraceae bacterium]